MLLESDGQDLSHDDGGSSSLSSPIPTVSPNLNYTKSKAGVNGGGLVFFWGREMSRGCVRLL